MFRPILVSSGSDLVVSMLAPPTAAAGDTLSVTDTTSNLGADPVGPSITRFHLSADPAVDVGDAIVGAREVPALAPSATSTGATTVTIPPTTPPGTYYLVARADADDAVVEGNELNNTIARRIAVGADVIVSALSTPATGAPGLAISVTETTLNQGASGADGSTTRFYLSTAATYSPGDPLIGSRAIASAGSGSIEHRRRDPHDSPDDRCRHLFRRGSRGCRWHRRGGERGQQHPVRDDPNRPARPD